MVADERENVSSIDIHATASEVVGVGISGSGNIIGKELSFYNMQGATVNIINPSKDVIGVLGDIKAANTQIDRSPSSRLIEHNRDIKNAQDIIAIKQQVSQVLEQINKIEKEKGTEIEEIRAGEIQISSKELLLKEIILKGNEHYYKGEHSEALQAYDKALEIDPNYADALNNKGAALKKLGKDKDTNKCFDKARQLTPKKQSFFKKLRK
jgi:tetratricopeptide (TPR) repeat protein